MAQTGGWGRGEAPRCLGVRPVLGSGSDGPRQASWSCSARRTEPGCRPKATPVPPGEGVTAQAHCFSLRSLPRPRQLSEPQDAQQDGHDRRSRPRPGRPCPHTPPGARGSQQPRADQAAQTPARGRPGQGSPEGGSNPEGARAMPRVGAAVPRRGRWCWAPGRWATVRGSAGPGCSEGGQPRRQHGGPEVPQAGPREARQPQFPHPSQGRGRPCPTGQQARPPGPRRGAGWPGALRKGREGEGRAGWGASLRSAWARVRFRNSPGRPKRSRPRSCHWPCSGGCICPHPVLPAPPPS